MYKSMCKKNLVQSKLSADPVGMNFFCFLLTVKRS